MKVLIVKLSAFGDVVHALHAVSYIKHKIPSLTIDWVVESPFSSVLKLSPYIDNIITVDTKRWRSRGLFHPDTLAEISETLKVLRTAGYDLVIDLQGNTKSGFFTAMTMCSRRAGFPKGRVRECTNILATNLRPAISSGLTNIRHQLLELGFSAISETLWSEEIIEGFNNFSCVTFAPSVLDRQRRILEDCGALSDKLLIGIHTSTTWSTKKWPKYFWLELSKRFVDNKLGQVLFFWGSEEERNEVLDFVKFRPEGFFMWKGGTIEELAAAIGMVDVFIAPDTGPLHLAAFVGVPTISLYRATSARRNGPPGSKHIHLQSALKCSPCLKKKCRRNNRCATSISIESVYEATERLLLS